MTTKLRVLTLLEQKRGQSISGESMAAELSLSRNSVWKAIQELRREGYQISAGQNRGYMLDFENDILSVQGMLPFLQNTGSADNIKVFDSVENTNKTAKELAISGAEHGTAVIANYQTAGRGRFNRSFFSPEGGLYLSVVLHPERLALESPTLVTAFAAVSACRVIERLCGRKPAIKWVNDIFLDKRKLCGILTEAVTDFESGVIQWIVVGIGVNFSIKKEDFPPELCDTATSLYPTGKAELTRNQLAAELINALTADVNAIDLPGEYKSRLMMLGEKITVNAANESFTATATDIDALGRLVIEHEDGRRQALSAGEISIKL